MFHPEKISLSEITSYSLFIYLLFSLLGVAIELFFFSQKVFSSNLSLYIGFGVIVIGTMIIIWEGYSGRGYRRQTGVNDEFSYGYLQKGIFKFTRNPHYIGLGLLIIGLGIMVNSLSILVFAGLSFITVNAWFIPREEAVLASRHGKHFDEYKQSTKRWF